MHTIFDWMTLLVFCGLSTLFLQRSIEPAVNGDRVIAYLPAALGCVLANWLGNGGHPILATAVLLATLGYIARVLLHLPR